MVCLLPDELEGSKTLQITLIEVKHLNKILLLAEKETVIFVFFFYSLNESIILAEFFFSVLGFV